MCSVNVSVRSGHPNSFTRTVFFSLAVKHPQVSDAVRCLFDQADTCVRMLHRVPVSSAEFKDISVHLNDPQCSGGVEYPN